MQGGLFSITKAQAEEISTLHEKYRAQLQQIFEPYFDKNFNSGSTAYCSLNFIVNEDGAIKSVSANDCNLTGQWEQSILASASKVKEKENLPPPHKWNKFGVQEILFIRTNNKGTTANPPLTKLLPPPTPPSLAFSQHQNSPNAAENKAMSSISQQRVNEIAAELKDSDNFKGESASSDQLIAEAKKYAGKVDSCPSGSRKLNVDAVPEYLAKSELINNQVAKSIETYTTKKITRSEAIDLHNTLVGKSNDLKFWADSNQVTNACGYRKLIEKISISHGSRSKLFQKFKELIN